MRTHFVYLYYSEITGNRPLYIGTTAYPVDRMFTHAKNSIWYDFWDYMKIIRCEGVSYEDVLALEKDAILTKNPIFNREHNPDPTLSFCCQKEGLRLRVNNLNSYDYQMRLYDGDIVTKFGDKADTVNWSVIDKELVNLKAPVAVVVRKFSSDDRPYHETDRSRHMIGYGSIFNRKIKTHIPLYLESIYISCLENPTNSNPSKLTAKEMLRIVEQDHPDFMADMGIREAGVGLFFTKVSNGFHKFDSEYELIKNTEKYKGCHTYSIKKK